MRERDKHDFLKVARVGLVKHGESEEQDRGWHRSGDSASLSGPFMGH